jgi:hypothetical protein
MDPPADGSLHAVVCSGDQRLDLFASYLSDAPAELARAAITLLCGAEQASLAWADEPGEARWVLRRIDGELDVTVLRFEETFSRRPNDEGKVLFETTVRLTDFAGQVKSQLDALLTALGLKRYALAWRHPFPSPEHEQLFRLVHRRHTR